MSSDLSELILVYRKKKSKKHLDFVRTTFDARSRSRLPAGRLRESESPRVHACRVFGIGRLDWRASVGIEVTGATTTKRHRALRWIAWPAQLWAAPKTLGCARRSLRGSRAFRSSRRLFRPARREALSPRDPPFLRPPSTWISRIASESLALEKSLDSDTMNRAVTRDRRRSPRLWPK